MPSSTSPGRRGQSKLRPVIWAGAAVLLVLPAVAMRFTTEVDWDARDFTTMGVLLAGACGIYELGVWLSGNRGYRAGFGIAVITGLLTVWVNLAVGMFGSEQNALNMMFAGVLLVAAGGASLAKFRAPGMATAMSAAALAQVAAAAIGMGVGLASGPDPQGGPGLLLETVLTAGFAVPWLLAAQLFRVAARDSGCR